VEVLQGAISAGTGNLATGAVFGMTIG